MFDGKAGNGNALCSENSTALPQSLTRNKKEIIVDFADAIGFCPSEERDGQSRRQRHWLILKRCGLTVSKAKLGATQP